MQPYATVALSLAGAVFVAHLAPISAACCGRRPSRWSSTDSHVWEVCDTHRMEFFVFACVGSAFFAIGAMIFAALTEDRDH